ncbi:AAA family ATPase [Streptomyces sp. NPDC060243]|uniref:AAA family ATPase n=1 Tax=Streptomyces sp. NPDC060243 TaxID=3347081 RepID=UPI00364B92FE
MPTTLMREIRRGRDRSSDTTIAHGPARQASTTFKIGIAESGRAKADALPDYELPDDVRTVMDLLNNKGQVILQGPPGTGKTRLALNVALSLSGRADLLEASPKERAAALAELSVVPGKTNAPEGVSELKEASEPEGERAAQLTMVTFHPSYGYEDFVEGFRPDTAAVGAGLHLKLQNGVFLRICAAAEKSPEKTFLIIVDEINRGDLPRVLGELITLLELDKRGSAAITLPTSGRHLKVPPNVRIIGTMNSADRSVSHIDSAIRRRFAFFDVVPDLDVLDGEIEGLGLASFLEGLNERLEKRFDLDHLIGQAYLLLDDRPLATVEQLYHAFHYAMVPVIKDYCLGRPDMLRSVLGELVIEDTGRIVQVNPQDLPGMLTKVFVAAGTTNEDGVRDSKEA